MKHPDQFSALRTILFGLAFQAAVCSFSRAASPDKPNIVVILSDDYGYGSAGCYGANPALVKTPNIDRLAAEGRRFTDANTTSSVCTPTRYSLLTGRYCWRSRLKQQTLGPCDPMLIEPTRMTLASMLKKHGYNTASVGKWHLGYGTAPRADFTTELSPGPLDIGFDYHFSVPSNHADVTGVFVENRFVYGLRSGKIPPSMKLPGPDLDEDGDFQPNYTAEDMDDPHAGLKILDIDAPRRKNDRVMKVLTHKAAGWIERQPRDKPFFLYFTPVTVHSPSTPDKDIAGQSPGGLFCDWIHELDRSVGRILATLDKLDLTKDTLVIFTSDNGGVKELTRDLLETKACKAGLAVNGSLRGGKHHIWEGGFKVPFIVRWPGKTQPGSVCREMISLADILATTAAIVGEDLPAASKAAEDSLSFLPAILGEPAKPVREDLIEHSATGVFAIRKGPWKWIEGVPVNKIKPGAPKDPPEGENHEQLYNLQEDPAETKDVSAQHPEIVKELRTLLNRCRDGG